MSVPSQQIPQNMALAVEQGMTQMYIALRLTVADWLLGLRQACQHHWRLNTVLQGFSPPCWQWKQAERQHSINKVQKWPRYAKLPKLTFWLAAVIRIVCPGYWLMFQGWIAWRCQWHLEHWWRNCTDEDARNSCLASFHVLKLSQGRTLGSPGALAKPDDGKNSKDVLQPEGFHCEREMYQLMIRRWKGNVMVFESWYLDGLAQKLFCSVILPQQTNCRRIVHWTRFCPVPVESVPFRFLEHKV